MSAAVLAAIAAIYFLFFWCSRRKIELTASLIEQSVVVVGTHPGVFPAAVFLMLIGGRNHATLYSGGVPCSAACHYPAA